MRTMYEEYQIEIAAAVSFAVACIGVLVLGLQALLLDLAIAGIGIWTVYRTVGGIIYGRAREAWSTVADRLDLEFREPPLGEIPESSTGPDDLAYFVMFLANSRRNFSLTGAVDDVDVAVRTERTRFGRSTVLGVDLADRWPDWLEIREASGAEQPEGWLAARDIPVGDQRFDEMYLVHGPDADAIGEFFADHPVTDVLVELGSRFDHVEIVERELRIVYPSVTDEASRLASDVEVLADHAGALRERFAPT